MRLSLATCLILSPFAALADESGQLVARSACEPLYTVQKRGCMAEHVLRCETPQGLIYRSEFIEDGELTDVEFADADFEFLASWNAEGATFLQGLVENRDPFSLSTLLETGNDTVDQTALVDPQFVAPREAEIVGISRLTGEMRQIGESEVERIAFEGSLDLTSTVWGIEGDMFLDRATGTLFSGVSQITIDGFTEEVPGDPVRIMREGDRAFMLNITLFDCGEAS